MLFRLLSVGVFLLVEFLGFAGSSKPVPTHQLLLLPLEALGLLGDGGELLHHAGVHLAELGQLRLGGGQQPQELLGGERGVRQFLRQCLLFVLRGCQLRGVPV